MNKPKVASPRNPRSYGLATRPVISNYWEATRKAAEATPRRLHPRLARGEKPNRERMAEVAAVWGHGNLA